MNWQIQVVHCLLIFYVMYPAFAPISAGVRSGVVARWTAGFYTRGMIHNKIHPISQGSPRHSIALQCRTLA